MFTVGTATAYQHGGQKRMTAMELVLSLLGILLGGIITIGTTVFVESKRRPHLKLEVCPPQDMDYLGQGRPANRMRILHLQVHNMPMSKMARWLSRAPATQCHGTITFHHLDGQNIFGRVMEIRWGNAPEPVPTQFTINGQSVLFYNPLVSLMQRKDIYPGHCEILNVAARFDDEEDCYGWSNANYFSNPKWRNSEWKLPRGRFLVRAIISSGEDRCEGVFRLINDVPVSDFRIEKALASDLSALAQSERT